MKDFIQNIFTISMKQVLNIIFLTVLFSGCNFQPSDNSQAVSSKISLDTLKSYYSNGKLLSLEPRKNGIKDGFATYFAYDGSIEMTQEYSNGKLNGITRHYNSYGNRTKEATFKNGELDGDLIIFYNNDTSRVMSYSNGVQVSARQYTEDTVYIYDTTHVERKIARQ